MERGKGESFSSFKPDFLPANCSSWLKKTSASAADFVQVYSEDFRTKLTRELVDLQQEQRDSLTTLKAAYSQLKEPSKTILSNLNILFRHFALKSPSPTTGGTDPWLNELAVRHNAAIFLELKSNYLCVLYTIYTQVKHLHSELSHKIAALSAEYFGILERFGMSARSSDVAEGLLDPFGGGGGGGAVSTWDEAVLQQFSLDYEWKLECPPLDGFLSTLFNNLKALGAELSLQISKTTSIPKIFHEKLLRFGFLQKSVSGLLSRSWQVFFVILQPSTGFLHFYKISSSTSTSTSTSSAGNLLVPTIGTIYTKSSLQDLNLLASQFFLQNSHQPAALSPQLLTPSLSFALSPDSKAAASDPGTFTLILRPNSSEKVTLRAFCEEQFVDWVIFLNEAAKSENKTGASCEHGSAQQTRETHQTAHIAPITHPSHTIIPSGSLEPASAEAAAVNFAPSAPIVDLENPWN